MRILTQICQTLGEIQAFDFYRLKEKFLWPVCRIRNLKMFLIIKISTAFSCHILYARYNNLVMSKYCFMVIKCRNGARAVKLIYLLFMVIFARNNSTAFELSFNQTGAVLMWCVYFMYCAGYGHSTPATLYGKLFTMCYAAIGIPLGLVMFQSIGERLNGFSSFAIRNIKKLAG
jgi:hypothetical protein